MPFDSAFRLSGTPQLAASTFAIARIGNIVPGVFAPVLDLRTFRTSRPLSLVRYYQAAALDQEQFSDEPGRPPRQARGFPKNMSNHVSRYGREAPLGGEIQNKEHCARAPERSLERDRQRHLHAPIIPEVRTIRQGLALRAPPTPWQHRSGYRSLIDKQLIPRLGAMTVSRLRFEHIDAAVSGMIEDELASKTVHNAVMLLRNMLAGRSGPSAFRRGLAFADHTLGVKLPPLEYRQIVPPTPEQTWAVNQAAKEIGGVGYPITYLGAFCGMRRSEVLGLRFLDVRWFDDEIRIQYAISKRRCQDGIHKWEWYLGPPKSRKSLRGISATESVMRLLADLKVGNADSGFVFAGGCHGFIDPDRFETEIWRPIVDRADLTGTRFHDLRHFFASQLIANGETAAYVRDQMGHSSIHVTFDTYGHLFPGRGREASDRYEKSMDVARRKSEGTVSNQLAIDRDVIRKSDTSN
jgi:integrase